MSFLPAVALNSVTSKSGKGVYASSDTLYKGAVFGRDSLEVAEDLLEIKPKLVRKILLTMARLQGQLEDNLSEEEPGKIIHEYRTTIVDSKMIDDVSMSIFKNLSSKWGGDDNEMAYYGSVDATPLFLRVLGLYCNENGQFILQEKVTLRRGQQVSVLQVAYNSAMWLLKKLESSKSGLLEFQKVNPNGISNQVWKDSEEFYVHKNKSLANHDSPIASIEIQGLAFDALTAAATLMPHLDDTLMSAAKSLQRKTLKHYWLSSNKYFALGNDYDPNNHPRLIKTKAANPAALLDTSIFDDLDEPMNIKYITAITENIMSTDFLTNGGIRSRALSESNLINHWDYHGSFVSWPKETFDIAKGLRRQGFPELARQLENRILNVCLKYKAYPEFVYVDKAGRVLATPPSGSIHGNTILVDGTNQPEHIQAWTVSAVIAIVDRRIKNKVTIRPKPKLDSWQRELEDKILSQIPIVDRHFNPIKLASHYPTYKYRLNRRVL